MKYKLISVSVSIVLILLSLTGCRGSTNGNDIPYPDSWLNQTTGTSKHTSEAKGSAEQAITSSSENSEKEISASETEDAASTPKPSGEENNSGKAADSAGTDSISRKINYFLDTSGSMYRSPEVVNVHAAAEKAGAGTEKTHYILGEDGKITETDERLALSGNYGYGAVIDVIGKEDIPVDPESVNILTTDLQSNTYGTEIGKWLVDTGSTGFSFYVFTMDYQGTVDFETYTSNTKMEYVSVSGCDFEREFLMIVFGDNSQVNDYDETFRKNLDGGTPYDFCHASLGEAEGEKAESLLELTSSKCFTENLAGITYDNTRYCYGLDQVDTDNCDFNLSNTFVYKKSRKSANDKPKAVKIILYTSPETEVPDITEQNVSVMEYDPEKKTYLPSGVTFSVDEKGYLDGLPASDDEEMNTKLGGNLVAAGQAAFVTTIANENLPKGLYAVEIELVCESSGEWNGLQEFASRHSAGLEEYTAALKTECEPKIVNGTPSSSQYTRTAEGPSVYSKLLEFEKIADELIASGAADKEQNDKITMRVVIDNR